MSERGAFYTTPTHPLAECPNPTHWGCICRPSPSTRSVAFFTDLLKMHNAMERELVATIRAGRTPRFTTHHALEEVMMYMMAELSNDEVAAAIEAYDATPGAML